MEKLCVASGRMPLAAVIVPGNVPAVVGVPEIMPLLLIVSPVGKPEALNVIGAVPVAVHVKLYGRPTVPVLTGIALVIVGATGDGLMTMEKLCVASGSVPLVAVIVPGNVPAVVGVPEITPLVLIDNPVGRPEALNVIGAVPVAVHVKLYGTPTMPVPIGVALVIVGATGAALMTMEKPCVASGRAPLAALIVPVNVPPVVGVPEMFPLLLIVSPVGRPEALNVIGAVPVAAQAKL